MAERNLHWGAAVHDQINYGGTLMLVDFLTSVLDESLLQLNVACWVLVMLLESAGAVRIPIAAMAIQWHTPRPGVLPAIIDLVEAGEAGKLNRGVSREIPVIR